MVAGRNYISWLMALAIVIFSTGAVVAQDASVTCTVNQNPTRANNRIQLTVTLTNCKTQSRQLTLEKIPGLQLISGPSFSQQTNIYNFKATYIYSYTFSYRVNSKTDITIPPVKLATSKGVMNSESFILKVISSDNKTEGRQDYGLLTSVVVTNKKSVHLGEPVIIRYKIYARDGRASCKITQLPELEGFWTENLPDKNNKQTIKIINGVEYVETVVKEILAFPQQTGAFTLDDFIIQGYKNVGFFQQQEIETGSKSATINVVPLPDGEPDGFIGTFANLRIQTKTDADSIQVNEAFNFELTFIGNGNLKLIREPELIWPVEFEVFDPEIIDNITINNAGESGRRTYKYVVIPRAPGEYQLPEVSISYYDYKDDKYIIRVLSNESILIKKGDKTDGDETTYSIKEKVKVLNHDIRHINTSHAHWGADGNEVLSWKLIWFLYILGPLFAVVALLFKRRADSELRDARGTLSKKSGRVFNRALDRCSGIDSKELAYAEIGEAIEVYLCAKLGWGRSQFSRGAAAEVLKEQMEGNDAEAWDSLLQKCEMARYAPGELPELSVIISEAKRLAKLSSDRITIRATNVIIFMLAFSPAFSVAQIDSDSSQNLNSKFEIANAAYLAGDYEVAVTEYESIAQGHRCFELEYNLGNAHYKLENIGEALLHYERAKLIDPLNDDLRANILLADLRSIDKIEPLPGVGLDKLAEVIFAGKMFNSWFILSLAFWTLGFTLMALKLSRPKSILSPFANSGAVLFLISSLLFSSFLYFTVDRMSNSSYAIVMDERVDVMSGPGEAGVKLFQLHEGARAYVIGVDGDWTEIKLENGNVGWLYSNAIEPI